MIFTLLTWKPQRECHFNNSREIREAEGAPGSAVWYLGLGVEFPLRALLDKVSYIH